MSTENRRGDGAPAAVQTPDELAEGLRLRPEHRQNIRLSRRVLVAGSALALAAVSGAVVWALQKNRTTWRTAEELYSTDRRTIAEGITALPRDYASMPRQVPQLGPPLPGDLGRPILSAQGLLPTAGTVVLDQEQQRREQETEAARVSRLFASTNVRDTPHTAVPSQAGDRATPSMTSVNSDDGFGQNAQGRKLAFVNAAVDRRTTSPDRLVKAAYPYVVQAGTVIPGALITGIRSDLSGQITAQVTENVWDTPTGRFLLIPQGARLIGVYDSQVTFGQSRVLMVWTRLIMPSGRSIVLERQSGADAAGYAGLEDDVDNHWGELFKAAALSTLLAVGTELGVGSDNNESAIVRALRRGGSESLNQTGNQVVRRSLNILPTLTVRPGFPVRVIVNRDLVLQPYRG